MADFRFKRLEKYKIDGTKDKIELSIPLPRSPSGKVYRWCPNAACSPRLFLLGDAGTISSLDTAKSLRRSPGTRGTTCPYCGVDMDDDEFNYEGDIEAIHAYVQWAVVRDLNEFMQRMAKDFNRAQPRGSLLSVTMDVKPDHTPPPRAWREDLIRNLACDVCGREYGVYAIALFCPDCGSHNLHVHFEREIELIIQQIDLAENVTTDGRSELSYRILGNAHEDVLTALETYQKTVYKHLVNQRFPAEEAAKMTSKRAIGNRFQNMERASKLYADLSIDPFAILTDAEVEQVRLSIQKRHVIGHNLSMSDEAYTYAKSHDLPGSTVDIFADQVTEFAGLAKKIVQELEQSI
jgi:hypothetical protein